MRYAIINETFVENVIVADQEFIDIHYPNAIPCDEIVCVGWTYDKGEFIAPPLIQSEESTE